MISQIVFACFLLVAIGFFAKSVKRIMSYINLGKNFDRSDNKGERWKNVILLAFGQKKMFKRPFPAVLHFFVYAGFLLVNIELLEIVLDGLLGTHRLFKPVLGTLYSPIINVFEFFAVAVLVSCVIFLVRRISGSVKRFHKVEMTSWPKWDANIILVFEIVLMLFLLNMNATDTAINSNSLGFFFSNFFVPLYKDISMDDLHLAERFYWWAHIIGVFIFANYVPYSKHLHIFLAFPNSYYADLEEKGKMENMETVTNEVQIMMGLKQPDPNPTATIPRFGAKDVVDLSQKSILDALTCTECGRCTDNCPANITGKLLSPRAIMMATRDRAEDVVAFKNKEGHDADDGKSLLGDYIKDEEINACTSCNACVEACPVSINPLSIITELRRYKVMEESQGPTEWNMMYQNIETSFSPWKFAPSDRFKWSESINVEPLNNTNNE